MKWYRVIVDEAQFIRNRNTKASKALAAVRTKLRWCLTGTPITNTLYVSYFLLPTSMLMESECVGRIYMGYCGLDIFGRSSESRSRHTEMLTNMAVD